MSGSTTRRLLRVELDPAGHPHRLIAIRRPAIILAALDRRPFLLPTTIPPAAIEDHAHAAIAIERECQRVVALGKIPRHDEQGRTARGQDRAVCRSRWNEDSH